MSWARAGRLLATWSRNRDAKRSKPLENEKGDGMLGFRGKDDGISVSCKEAFINAAVVLVVVVMMSVAPPVRAVLVAQVEVADG